MHADKFKRKNSTDKIRRNISSRIYFTGMYRMNRIKDYDQMFLGFNILNILSIPVNKV